MQKNTSSRKNKVSPILEVRKVLDSVLCRRSGLVEVEGMLFFVGLFWFILILRHDTCAAMPNL